MRRSTLPGRDEYSLSGVLPYHSADPDGDVFLLRDGSLGLAWSLDAAETETSSPDALSALASRFEALLKLLPVGAAAQFIRRSTTAIAPRVRPWLDATKVPGLLTDLANSRAAATERFSYIHEGIPFLPRRLDVLFTLRVWPRWPRSDWRARYGSEKRSLLDSAGSIESLLVQAGIRHRKRTAAELFECVHRELNGARPIARDGDRPMAEGLALSFLTARDGEILLAGETRRLLSAADLPRETWPGMLQRGVGAPLDFAGAGTLVLNIDCRDSESVKKSLGAKKRLAFCQMSGAADGRADIATIKSEVDAVLARMVIEGARAYSVRIHLVVPTADPAALSSSTNALSRVGLEMIAEENLAGTVYLQTLPLAYDPTNDRLLKRGRTLLGSNLSHLLPLYGAFQGSAGPDLLLVNRKGEPITFSFFDSEVAPHGIVAGVSGSGKSVLANVLVMSTARRGAHHFILDRGNSYRKMCGLLGGSYVSFEPSRPISVNPCGRGLDEDKLLFLTDIVAEMVTQGQREATVKERSLLSRAVRRAFQGHDREVLMSDIRAALFSDDEASSRDLALSMEIFCGDGPYAGFFDRPCAIDFARSPVVFELGEIAKRRDVASVLLMALIHNVTQFCRTHLAQEKYLLVDEAWTLLRTENTAAFLEDVLRTYRKLNAAAIMITQQVTDFEGRTGEAIRANAPNRLFLRQTSETVQVMERLLDLSAEEKELLGSLETVKGRYSEMLVLAGAARGVARLVPDGLGYWLSTSDAQDGAMLDERVASHAARGAADPVRAALQELALRRPHGARARHE